MNLNSHELALFSLFHHDVDFREEHQINTNQLLKYAENQRNIKIEDLGDSILETIEQAIVGLKNNEISLTLTGGMDSRVILACLLKLGVKPNCLTFGNPKSADVLFAKKIAHAFNLNFHNVVKTPPKKEEYKFWVDEVIKLDNGNSHLHRAHRYSAMIEHTKLYNPKVLLVGHLGGEGLRGLGYNNYFASRFYEEVNKNGKPIVETLKNVLNEYFLREDTLNYKALIEKIEGLSYMSHDSNLNEFYFLYDLVGNIHHHQDLRIYEKFIDKVVPVYMTEKYLENLFSSNHHFLNKPQGIIGKLKNPMVHSQIIQYLYPKLLKFPLSKGYKPSEYLKGLWYVVPKKIWRKYTSQKKYESNFSYGNWYIDFVKNYAENISPEVWKYFDKQRYMNALYNDNHGKTEGYWHKFSNPIFFDLRRKLL